MYNLEALEQVKEKAIANKIPILMDETLDEILEILKEENPKEILEIGTAIGYSASQFAITIPGVHIDTIELSEERANEARNNIKILAQILKLIFFKAMQWRFCQHLINNMM